MQVVGLVLSLLLMPQGMAGTLLLTDLYFVLDLADELHYEEAYCYEQAKYDDGSDHLHEANP